MFRARKYYRNQLIKLYKFNISEKSRVLEIGCRDGYLLDALNPGYGVGIDNNDVRLKANKKKYPKLTFLDSNLTDYKLKEKFDFVIISDSISHFSDVQKVFNQLRQNCTHKTRIIVNHYNFLWEPILRFAEFVGVKKKQKLTNWLSQNSIKEILKLENFDIVNTGTRILIPFNIPLISWFFNKYFSQLPFFRLFCLVQYLVARPIQLEKRKEKTVSIVVPAMNEEGNIEEIVKTLPDLGKGTEIIFVEGGSKDNTWKEIKRVKKKYKKKITCYKQDGKGKYDAVKKGFDKAKGEILMIYDADRTVPETDLIKFYEAIVSNNGEFVFGSRLTYPMEKEAMRTINLIGNKMFSMVFTWILGQPIHDTLCGTKVMTRDNYEILAANRKYFGDFDPFGDFDLILGSAKMNLKLTEIPIRYKARTYGSTNISRFSHGWILIKMVLFSLGKIKFVK